MRVIRGGDVLTTSGWARTDVVVEDGMVAALEVGAQGDEVIDASGCLVGPGFVDMHTHLREPGQTWKEDIASASAAAVAGGFTAVTAMPNTEPAMDDPKVVETVMSIAARVDLVEVIPSGALTVGRSGTTPSDLEALHNAGVRLFTDDGDSVADPAVLEEAMRVIAGLEGALVAQHAEDASLTKDAHMNEGAFSRRLGVRGMPASAETAVVRRDLALAARTRVRYHCQHVSAKDTVDVIREAKGSGMPVTAEVTPHHLTFDESSLATLDPNFKMYPPLRTADDRAALIDGLASGVIDVVATDHAPHLAEEKSVGFPNAPRGVIGLETAAAAVWEALGDRDRLFTSLSIAPARILGLDHQGMALHPGAPANLVVFDPRSSWVVESFESRAANSPYRGRRMKGEVKATIRNGRVVHRKEGRTG